MLDLIVRLLFCHLLGDYVLQTPFLAETKGRNWYHMFAHCTLYSLPFYIFFGLNWQLAVLFFSHLCIDTAKARYQKISYVADQALHYCILLTYIILHEQTCSADTEGICEDMLVVCTQKANKSVRFKKGYFLIRCRIQKKVRKKC